MINWIDVKSVAESLKHKISDYIKLNSINKSLWVFSSGENDASNAYVNGKRKDCEEVGISFNHIKVSERNVKDSLNIIEAIQKDKNNSIIIQSPFVDKNVEKILMDSVSPVSDADRLSSCSMGNMYKNCKTYPATALGVKLLLYSFGWKDLSTKRAVVVGRSFLAGQPCAKVLQDMNATVTIIHSKSVDYSDIIKSADIVVLAVGKAGMFTENDFKDNTLVIDVGISKDENGKLHGDFKLLNENTDKNLFVTPVPNGMGLMTRVGLLYNIIYQ